MVNMTAGPMPKDLEAALAAKAHSVRNRVATEVAGIRETRAREIAGTDAPQYADHLSAVVMSGYAVDQMVEALPKDCWVVKGGQAMRVVDDGQIRPTIDLDVQSIDALDARLLYDDVKRVVGDPAWMRKTGLVVTELSVRPIKNGLENSYCIEGKAFLGPPERTLPNGKIARGTEIPIRIEATGLPVPERSFEVREWRPWVAPERSTAPGAAIAVSRGEYIAADKLHAIVRHGKGNSRLKDFRDLHRILPKERFDGYECRRLAQVVFDVEHQGRQQFPATAQELPGLQASFATAERENVWRRNWAEWTGRPFDERRDIPFGSAVAQARFAVEHVGLVGRSPAVEMAEQLHRIESAALDVGMGRATPERMRDVADAIRRAAELASQVDPAELAFVREGLHRHAWARADGRYTYQPPQPAQEAFQNAMMTIRASEHMPNLTAAARELGIDHLGKAAGVVHRSLPTAHYVPVDPEAPAVSPRATAPAPDHDRLLADGMNMLDAGKATGNPGLWATAAFRAVEAIGKGADPQPHMERLRAALAAERPDKDKVEAAWRGIAARYNRGVGPGERLPDELSTVGVWLDAVSVGRMDVAEVRHEVAVSHTAPGM